MTTGTSYYTQQPLVEDEVDPFYRDGVTVRFSCDVGYLNLDCSKSTQLLGWSPKLNLGKALELLVDWYQGYASNVNLRELSINQLTYFENLK